MGSIENNNSSENMNNISFGKISSGKSPKEIRKKSFLTWLKDIFCPNFKYTSIIFILSCIDLITYIITLFFGIKRTNTELLAPLYQTLDLFGMKIPAKIYRGQIHRLILFGILHANLVHLISNLFSQIILGFFLEDLIGNFKLSILYLLSNIFGGLFSSVMNQAAGVGASVAIFGILGGFFGFTVINWETVKNNFNYLINLIFLIIIVIANASIGVGSETIDNFGHLGGLIYGFLFIFVLIEPKNGNRSSLWIEFDTWKKYAVIFICASIALLVIVFWLFQNH
jgi:membrane associated rhomboid family serine protease